MAATTVVFHELGAIAIDVYSLPLDLKRASATFVNHRGIIFATDQPLATDIRAML